MASPKKYRSGAIADFEIVNGAGEVVPTDLIGVIPDTTGVTVTLKDGATTWFVFNTPFEFQRPVRFENLTITIVGGSATVLYGYE